MHKALCVTVTFDLCTRPVVSQDLICHKVRYVICSTVRVTVRAGIPLETYRIMCIKVCDTMDRATQWVPFS